MPNWVKKRAESATHRKYRASGYAARGLDDAALAQIAMDGLADGLTEGHEKDAFIDDETLAMLHVAHREKRGDRLEALLASKEVGRWERDDELGGYWVHDYLEDNPTAAEWESTVEAKKRAGRAGGKASGQSRAEASASHSVRTDGEPVSLRFVGSSNQRRRSQPTESPGGRIPEPAASCENCTNGWAENEDGSVRACNHEAATA